MDGLAREYCALALAADRLFPGLVDAYFGPPELRSEALAGPAPEAGDLLARAASLCAGAAAAEPGRRPFLEAQAAALETTCRVLAGEEVGFHRRVRETFGVEAPYTPEAELDDAIEALGEALPGTGDVRERMLAWNGRFEIGTDALPRLLGLAAAELRARTSLVVTLPPGEDVEVELVSGNPWIAYNRYRGELLSTIEVETDRPSYANEVVEIVAHEMYPGHHTERSVKESLLYRGRGWGEHAVVLTLAPEAVVSEGIAELAAATVMPGGELFRFQADALYPAVGLRGDPLREEAIAAARVRLSGVGANASILLHAEGRPEAEVEAYIRRYGVLDDASARANLRFVADPLWSAFAVAYPLGRRIVGDWLGADGPDGRPARLSRLLAEPLTPGVLLDELRGR